MRPYNDNPTLLNVADAITDVAMLNYIGYDVAPSVNTYAAITQTSAIADVFLSDDGSKLFILSRQTSNERIYQYTLLTPFDLSTASYASKVFNFTAQETNPQGFFFGDSGSRMYLVGNNETVYQYTLSTAWDISTASYTSNSFLASGTASDTTDVWISPNGTFMAICASTDKEVYQFTLSTAWDVSTASYASKSFDLSGQVVTPASLFFSQNGDKSFVADANSPNPRIYQYSLSTPFDLATASYDSKFLSTSGFASNIAGMWFDFYGLQLFFANTDDIYRYNMPAMYDDS